MRRKNITSDMMINYITEALLKLMEEKNYAKITVSDICKKAGVNRSTYYRHFYLKEDIIRHYLSEIMHSYLEKYKSYKSNTAEDYFDIMFSEFLLHKQQLLLIHKEHLSFLMIDILNEYFSLSDITDKTEQFKTAYHIGGIYNNLMLWFTHDMSESAEEMRTISLSAPVPQDITLRFKTKAEQNE